MLHISACHTYACKATAFLFVSCCLLSACATSNDDFPSLAKRPYEKAGAIEDPDALPPNAAPIAQTTRLPDALAQTTAQLKQRNNVAHAAFGQARAAAETSAQKAADAAQGSETWAEAHMILSRLDRTRSDSVVALGEIDRLIGQEQDKKSDLGLIALLTEVQQDIAASVTEQNVVIERLTRTIGR
jgi:hypothetical protein